jgi:antitoxin component YwqK of YwqJK toxin-antitoxin module
MGRYRGGAPDGTAVYFDDSMDAAEIRSFRRGTPEGLAVGLHKPEGGRQSIARVGVVSEGKLHGPVFGFDLEGKVSSYGRYEGGAKDGDWYEYHPDGSVKSLTGYRRSGGRTGWRSWEPGEGAGAPPEFPAQDDLDRLISEARAIGSQAMKLRP